VLAALNLTAIGLGLGAGGLSATVIGLILGFGLDIAGFESGPDIGLVVGVASGLVVGGWVAGLMSRHSGRFHGAITGLLLAAVVTVVARFGGSPAETWAVVWVYVFSAAISGFSGWMADRRRLRKS
jgi:hypothetical protein